MAYRCAIDHLARSSEEFAAMVRWQFAHDIVWAVNTFFWTRDTRLEVTDRPFILMDFQIPVLKAIATAKKDVVVVKPRDMGMSWITLVRFVHGFMCQRGVNYHCISKNEDAVDKKGDPNCLFWKMHYMLDMFPAYLRPNFQHTHMLITNLENDCTITGEATSETAGRSGRASQMLVDECAAIKNLRMILQNVSSTAPRMVWVSTVKGTGGFYELSLRKDAEQMRLAWTDDPRKCVNMRPIEESPNYELLKGLTTHTSDWIEDQCAKLPHRYLLAQEVFCRFDASDYRYFPVDECNKWIEKCRHPSDFGVLDYNESFTDIRFTRLERGTMKCFVDSAKIADDVKNPRLTRRWVISCDISEGSGASNSVAMLCDADTKTQLAVIKTANMEPVSFAHLVYAFWIWAGRPYIIWERNGPGVTFTKTLMALDITNCYMSEGSEVDYQKRPKTVPGWWSTTEAKNDLFRSFRFALLNGDFIPADKTLVEEFSKIVFREGNATHTDQTDPDEESGARESHADQVIAAALAVKAFGQIAPPPPPPPPPPPKISDFERRMDIYRAEDDNDDGRWV